jgi:hypothetical protein
LLALLNEMERIGNIVIPWMDNKNHFLQALLLLKFGIIICPENPY